MKTTLGLDQDLINAVSQIVESSCSSKKMEKEELHPNQKVLDKNKNGKLDSDDFKKLRKEEAEELEEAGKVYDPITKKMVDRKSIKTKMGGGATRNGVPVTGSTAPVKEELTLEDYSVEEIEEFMQTESYEQLDELSKNTLQNYIAGASTDMARSGNTLGRLQTHGKLPDVEKRISKTLSKRYHGINKAADKLTKEQVEQLDELSKTTLGSYIKKAHFQGGMADYKQGTLVSAPKSGKAKRDEYGSTSEKRQKGINKAVDKLTKEQVEEIEALAAKHGLGE